MIKKNFKYIDLFAGIGGFHQAMRRLGGCCVYFCEKNQHCVDVYNHNYNLEQKIPFDFDIKDRHKEIPAFDVLCAGFPCQPFSKAGHQKGFEDEGRGDLFYNVCEIIDEHPECKFLILENVRNLADDEDNWNIIRTQLMKRNFVITEKPIILSPHQFGIPQIRERVYILGIKKEYKDEKYLTNGFIHLDDLAIDKMFKTCPDNSIPLILEQNVDSKYYVDQDIVDVLEAWSEFKTQTNLGVIGKPIWMSCFGIGIDDTENFRSNIGYYNFKRDKDGNILYKIIYDEKGGEKSREPLPLYPRWKKQYVDFNRNFYLQHRIFIDTWVVKHNFGSEIKLHQKFEWNCGTTCDNIKDGIIQIRQSGIRVKRPNFFPSLVAMNNTPIVWDTSINRYRYITPIEAAKLQSFDKGIWFSSNDNETYRQLGNSVNVNIIEIIAKKLFRLGLWKLPIGQGDN